MSRKHHLSRGIVLIALSVLAVSACTPPLPPDVLAAKAENSITCQTGDQPVAMPEDFVGSMMQVSANLQGVCPDQSISEAAAGDPSKVQLLDHAPSADELAAFAKTCPTAPIVVPAVAYPVALTYSIIGLEGLVLSPTVIAGMLDGTITSWEDPAIAEANGGIDLTGLPEISVLALDHPSGAVEAMTTWLAKEAPEAWTHGAVGTLPNATTTYATEADLLADLTANEGGIAVLPVFQAVNNSLSVAALPVQDVVVTPDDTGLAKVGAGATTLTVDANGNITATPAVGGVPTEGNFDLAASKVVLADGQPLIGWPVMGIAHMMVCDDGTDPLPLSTAQYIVRLAGQGGLESFGLTPLPEPIRIKTFTPLKVTVDPNAPSAPASAPASFDASAPASSAASAEASAPASSAASAEASAPAS
jgi:phosphate transport system substrate-binding protein